MGNCIQDIVYKKINLFFIFKKKDTIKTQGEKQDSLNLIPMSCNMLS